MSDTKAPEDKVDDRGRKGDTEDMDYEHVVRMGDVKAIPVEVLIDAMQDSIQNIGVKRDTVFSGIPAIGVDRGAEV